MGVAKAATGGGGVKTKIAKAVVGGTYGAAKGAAVGGTAGVGVGAVRRLSGSRQRAKTRGQAVKLNQQLNVNRQIANSHRFNAPAGRTSIGQAQPKASPSTHKFESQHQVLQGK